MLRNAATDRQTGVATLSLYDFIIMPSSACAGVYLLEHIDIYIYIYFIHERNVIKNYTRRFLNEIENVLQCVRYHPRLSATFFKTTFHIPRQTKLHSRVILLIIWITKIHNRLYIYISLVERLFSSSKRNGNKRRGEKSQNSPRVEMKRKKNAYIEISIDPFERGTQTSTERQVNYSFLSLRERKAVSNPIVFYRNARYAAC